MSSGSILQITELKRTLSFLILGQKGGKNRMEILELLRDRPYNINQMADKLGLNYRTVKHHIDILQKYQLINSSKTGGYGEVFFLSTDLEGNMPIYDAIVQKIDSVKQLADFTDSPQFFKNVLQQTYEGVIIVDADWDVFFWNDSASRIFGYRNEEILHVPLNIFFDAGTCNELKMKVEKEGRLDDQETFGINKSGERIDINITIDPISDGEENVIGYSILSRDISERKWAEAQMASKSNTLEIIMANTRTGIAYLDRDFNFLQVNSAYAKGSGHKKGDFKGHNHFTLFPSKENEAIFEKVRSSGKTFEVFDKPYEFPDQPKRGVTYWNWALVPVEDGSGKVISMVHTLKETTRSVKARQKEGSDQ
jgi:PAS domain S-box-containing protein